MQLVNSAENTCISDFPFVAVEKQEGLDDTNGIVGLGPQSNQKASLLSRLKQSQKIDKAMISFDLGDALKGEDSFALIGGYDVSKVVDRKLYSFAIAGDLEYWSVETKTVKYGD